MKLFGNIPHHMCICSYRENVRLLLVALKVHTAFALEFQTTRMHVPVNVTTVVKDK